jgi:hypothetical protein
MNSYDPEQSPDSNTWLSLSEDDRIHLAMVTHESSNTELLSQSLSLHASIHVVVENQLALNTEFIPETLVALMKLGMSRHNAVHAIGAVILEELQSAARGGETFTSAQYRRKFDDLIKASGGSSASILA